MDKILRDIAKNGKERDWKNKKIRSDFMAAHYHELHARSGNPYYDSKADKIDHCAEFLTFKKTDEGRLKLYQTYFCKVRLCPMCAWRRSLKIAHNNYQIVKEVNRTRDVQWLFLTLTVKNVSGDQLKDSITGMMKGFHRMFGYKRFKNVVLGFFRSLEITKNHENGSYHPHFHVLLAVKKRYFGESYIKHVEWCNAWAKAMKLDYVPVLDIRKVKPKNDLDLQQYQDEFLQKMEQEKAVYEVSKYPVKDSDILKNSYVSDDNLDSVDTLDSALAARRLISYGGLMKDVNQQLNLDDGENGDLLDVGENDDKVANGAFDVVAYWNSTLSNYYIKENAVSKDDKSKM